MHPDHDPVPQKRPWIAPELENLGVLQDLTLQSGIGGGEGGFTWFPGADPLRTLG
ncbi:MAG: hypothetical protein AVDCRST_MAG68-1486 [uncultured Gemmatimonadetes bacterium]|uniref:Uncharacterized protein n=1 Tax=uncultured Gemmatimonadota bacterium TaxID=203437 RepID=A0A6J4KUN8_9BACT|nr:MAG: hypothetical protein AVDCRST_MAG68-1486 [uncultured Gemmatimonadota bacterium]